jgi:hypothetical protein
MSVIALPAALQTARMSWGQQRYDLNFAGGDSGAQQTRVLAPPRWLASILAPDIVNELNASEWSTLIMLLRGRVNVLALHYLGKPAPVGTMRGTLTANAAALAGATSLVITGGAGQAATTLKKGDWIGVNQAATSRQLLHITADATANGSGVITVSFEPPLRVDVAAASSVVWDKPTALFRQIPTQSQWRHDGAIRSGYSLDMIESWEG